MPDTGRKSCRNGDADVERDGSGNDAVDNEKGNEKGEGNGDETAAQLEGDEADLISSLTAKSAEREAFSLDDLRTLFRCGAGGAQDGAPKVDP